MLAGAVAAYLQFTQQQAVQLQTSEVSRKTSEDLRLSNQVAKGFEQLAANNSITMRLGGIYALEGVMNAPNSEYHEPVLEALCAFVRDNTKDHTGESPPATDIQAGLTVIGRRTDGRGQVNLAFTKVPQGNLSGANLSGADLRSADLSRADLKGADLSRADLKGANLSVADLIGADLSGADLDGQQLDAACGTHVTLPDRTIRDLKPCPDK